MSWTDSGVGRCCGETCDLGLCKQYTYHGRTTRTFSRAHLVPCSQPFVLEKISSPFAPCRHRHSLHQTQHTLHSTQHLLTSYADHMEAPPLHSGPFGSLAIQSLLTECAPRIQNPLTITLGNESGNLINLTSLLVEYQLILCAQTSREEVGRVSIEPLNVALDQKTHHPGNAQNKVANGCWTQKSSYDTCCVGNGENMFSI